MSISPDPSCDDDLVLARASARRLMAPRGATVADTTAFVDSSVNEIDNERGFAPLRASLAARKDNDPSREVCVACVGLPRRVAKPAPLIDLVERTRETSPDLPFDLHAIEATGVNAWNKLLTWACAATNAHGAFVTDRDGLLIATHGAARSPGGFDVIGPHMVVAFSQLPPLGDPPASAEWAVIHCGGERVIAIRFDTSLTGEVLLVLLVESDPPSRAIDRVIQATRAFVKLT